MCLFEWDDEKAKANLAHHGISFKAAQKVFSDPYRLIDRDDRYDYGEDRWQAIGMVEEGCPMLFVVFTNREDNTEVIRIISARRAKPQERRRYGNRKI